jgi:hypothetical protein
MRRTWAILLLAAGAARPAQAAPPVTVAQLQQWLDEVRGKPDGKIAGQISKLELTERVSSAQLNRWLAEFPGKHTRDVLTGLADTSAFLDLPAAEIRSDPTPDITTQQELFRQAVEYASKALSRLPNFYATRETMHFEDTLPKQSYQQSVSSGGRFNARSLTLAPGMASVSPYVPIHKTRVYSTQVRYRDGEEVSGPQEAKDNARERETTGLTTSGEFGPILYVVLEDSIKGKIVWDHWEQGAGGPVAVFQYTVPQADSHYMVEMQQLVIGAEQLFPAYHGEIAVDPANAAIVRISVVADMAPPYEIVQAALLVEYAPVTIGARTYVCPVHSVALSRMPTVASYSGELQAASLQTQVNDVSFKDYHLFRGDARILTNAQVGNTAVPAATPPPGVP